MDGHKRGSTPYSKRAYRPDPRERRRPGKAAPRPRLPGPRTNGTHGAKSAAATDSRKDQLGRTPEQTERACASPAPLRLEPRSVAPHSAGDPRCPSGWRLRRPPERFDPAGRCRGSVSPTLSQLQGSTSDAGDGTTVENPPSVQRTGSSSSFSVEKYRCGENQVKGSSEPLKTLNSQVGRAAPASPSRAVQVCICI